jgi:hypothetical protein
MSTEQQKKTLNDSLVEEEDRDKSDGFSKDEESEVLDEMLPDQTMMLDKDYLPALQEAKEKTPY